MNFVKMKDDLYFLSRPDRYKKGLQMTYELFRLVDEMKLSREDFGLLYAELDEVFINEFT